MKLVLKSLILLLLLTGCNIFKKNMFVKRKYTKGYFVESKHSNRTLEAHNSKPSNKINKLKKNQIEEVNYAGIDNGTIGYTSGVEKNRRLQSNFKTKKDVLRDKLGFTTMSMHSREKEKKFTLNCADKLVVSIDEQTSNNGNTAEVVKFILYTILFIFLAVIYTVSLLVKAPGMPLVLAIPIAIVLALLTVITGVYFF
ncbi:MAG: hypothetical protein SFY56_02060 [Bacteroidota bacterium]|nr:hypothetical protein [Bacteroidota bacterium]